jgi:hypothetical protein
MQIPVESLNDHRTEITRKNDLVQNVILKAIAEIVIDNTECLLPIRILLQKIQKRKHVLLKNQIKLEVTVVNKLILFDI